MHLSALLDVDLVAVETTDELTLLVELTAPTPTNSVKRQPATAVLVVDTSGSMRGGRLDAAKGALLDLVDRLDPEDNFGVVAFDSQVRIVVPTEPLVDKASVKRAIAALEPGGSTDLSAGYFRGLQEAQRVQGPTGALVLVLSDGRATHGSRDTDLCSVVPTSPTWSRLPTAVRVDLMGRGVPLWHDLVAELRPHVIVTLVAYRHLERIAFPLLDDWKTVHTVERANPYVVEARRIALPDGATSLLVRGRAANTPFSFVPCRPLDSQDVRFARPLLEPIGRWRGS